MLIHALKCKVKSVVKRSLSTPLVLVLLFMAHGPLSRLSTDTRAAALPSAIIDERTNLTAENAPEVAQLGFAAIQVLQALDMASGATPLWQAMADGQREAGSIEPCGTRGTYQLTITDQDQTRSWSTGDSLLQAFSPNCILGTGQAVEGIRHATLISYDSRSTSYRLQLDHYRLALEGGQYGLSDSSLLVTQTQRQLDDGRIRLSSTYTPDSERDVASGFMHSQHGLLRLMNYSFESSWTGKPGLRPDEHTWSLAQGQVAAVASPRLGGFDLMGIRPFVTRPTRSVSVDGELRIIGRHGDYIRLLAGADGRLRYFTHIDGVTNGPVFLQP